MNPAESTIAEALARYAAAVRHVTLLGVELSYLDSNTTDAELAAARAELSAATDACAQLMRGAK